MAREDWRKLGGNAALLFGEASDETEKSLLVDQDGRPLVRSYKAEVDAVSTLHNAAAADGNGSDLDISGWGAVIVQVIGTFSATLTWKGSLDGTTFDDLEGVRLNGGAKSTTATAAGLYLVPTPGLATFRAPISGYASGSVTVKARPYSTLAQALADVAVDLNASDVQIGAVEMKNATSDDRAKVAAATGVTEADFAVAVAAAILGVTTGAAVITDADGTLQQYLRGLVKMLSEGSALTQGDKAHDAADGGNPLKIGGQASTGIPAAVADGDRVNAYFDENGRLVVKLDLELPAGSQNIGDVDVASHPTASVSPADYATTNNYDDIPGTEIDANNKGYGSWAYRVEEVGGVNGITVKAVGTVDGSTYFDLKTYDQDNAQRASAEVSIGASGSAVLVIPAGTAAGALKSVKLQAKSTNVNNSGTARGRGFAK